MEEILNKMETALTQLQPENNSSFGNLYKNWGKFDRQEERRKETLEFQKMSRQTKLDASRGILNLVNQVEGEDWCKTRKKAFYRPSIYVAGFSTVSTSYKNALMMSEWLIEKPSDLAENWSITPCPKGVRVLVVAYRGRTKLYTKYGQFKLQTATLLPGGNHSSSAPTTVLDCFYHESGNTLYVLDLLAWNNQPMTDCEAEFRYYWLQQQLTEKPELGRISKVNKIKFHLLPRVLCKPQYLNEFMMKFPQFPDHDPKLDGLLFFHKNGRYVSGETPIVGWLFPFMVNEVLGEDITVNKAYMLEMPLDYTNQANFIKKFEEKYAKKHRRTSKSDAMEVTETKVENGDEKTTSADSTSSTAMDNDLLTGGTHSSTATSTEMESEGVERTIGDSKSNKEVLDSSSVMDSDETSKVNDVIE